MQSGLSRKNTAGQASSGTQRLGSRGIVVAAGSWTCGLIVGVLATFILLGQTAPNAANPPDETAQVEEKIQDTNPQPTPVEPKRKTAPRHKRPLPEKYETMPRNSALAALLADPLGDRDSLCRPDDLTLRAGMCLVQSTKRPGPRKPMPSYPETGQGPLESWNPHADSREPITRGQLLDDLLHETPGHVM